MHFMIQLLFDMHHHESNFNYARWLFSTFCCCSYSLLLTFFLVLVWRLQWRLEFMNGFQDWNTVAYAYIKY